VALGPPGLQVLRRDPGTFPPTGTAYQTAELVNCPMLTMTTLRLIWLFGQVDHRLRERC
jgi:hypothetical protein